MNICMQSVKKKLVFTCSFLCLSIHSLNTQAELIPTGNGSVLLNVDSSGILHGGQNINVNGILYDVEFDNRSFTDIFVNQSGMDTNDKNMALLFTQAIFDQVVVNTASLVFDTNPEYTYGCQGVTDCQIITPYELHPTFVIAALANNSNNESRDFTTSNADGPLAPGGARPRPLPPGDTLVTGNVYADWSLSSNRTRIPEPSTLLMVVLAVALFSKRIKASMRH